MVLLLNFKPVGGQLHLGMKPYLQTTSISPHGIFLYSFRGAPIISIFMTSYE